MVEFRPIIKANNDYEIVYTAIIKPDNWQQISVGDYVTVGESVAIQIKLNNPLEVTNVSSNSLADVSFYKEETGDNIYTIYGRLLDGKSPQKIGITIEQDENYVKFEPVITSNVEYVRLDFYLNNYQKRINIGDYIPKDAYLRANFYLKNNVDELTVFTFNGVNIGYRRSSVDDTSFNINQIYNYDSPQEVNITIDEYIRYEDIVQPYPVVFQIKDRNTNQIYSWGDKIKVGSSIQLTQGENPNLLNGLYSIRSYEYEGKAYSYNQLTNLNITVTKQSISLSCNKIWLLDNNEPKVILSPRLLRIPNSSYKILGHIPDISGHGNHGKINNSAYAGMSGANGYPNNFNGYTVVSGVTKTDSAIKVEKELTGSGWLLLIPANTAVASMKLNIVGIPSNKTIKWSTNVEGIGDITLVNGINEIPTYTSASTSGIYTIFSDLKDLKIEQIGEYEGAYCLDGVDDFISIPTLSSGGKQMLMKVNWNSLNHVLYDQRNNAEAPFCIVTASGSIAYNQRNIGGNTYIDGILNNHILVADLQAITHNIVLNNDYNVANSNSFIGTNYTKSIYAKMSLYDFMLFDNISTDDKIKELNTYIGITPKVTLPNYYWDNYGKKNTDANRGHVDEQVSLQKTGTSVNPLENFNISYEGMSGYNGYPVVFGASKTWESLSSVYSYTSNVTNTTIHVTHAEHAGNGLLFSYVKKDGALANIKEIPAFRVTVGGLEGNSKFGYRYLATEDATEETLVYLGNGTHELAKSFAPTEALLDLTRNVWVGIFITPMIEGEVVFDCDITIEVLPEYENGLAYDGVSDFSQNTEIEVVEDFTFLVKGSLLKGLTGSGGCIARKGDKKHYDTGGYAFIYCFDSPIESYRNSYYSFGKSFVPSKEIVAPPLIGYMTKTNVNGETTTFGTNSDIKGIIFGNWSSGYMNMVIYKSIFYTKTISLLEINFLKNLMEKDEIIDINHPIFISNTEDESNTSQDT